VARFINRYPSVGGERLKLLHHARYELGRFFATRRGWLAMLGLLLVWGLLLATVLRPAVAVFNSADASGLLELLLQQFGAQDAMGNVPTELTLYRWIALYLLPLFALIVAADAFASDRQRGTLRFITLHSERAPLFFGRVLGQIILQGFIVFVTLTSVVALTFYYKPSEARGYGVHLAPVAIEVFVALLPYAALMALMSVVAKSARQATLYAVGLWVGVSIATAFIANRFGPVPLLDWLLPGSQISAELLLHGWDALQFAAISLVHTAVLLVIGWWCLDRVDV